MGVIGISLLVASFVYVILRPPPWIPPHFIIWRGLLPLSLRPPRPSSSSSEAAARKGPASAVEKPVESRDPPSGQARAGPETRPSLSLSTPEEEREHEDKAVRQLMPPTPPPPIIQPPTLAEPDSEEHATPKAGPSKPSFAVPSFSLTNDDDSAPPPPPPPPPSRPTPAAAAASASAMMPPPPLPLSGRRPPSGRLPSLTQFPAANSAQRARGPTPNRGSAPSLVGGLAPPPTHSSKPAKPSRQVQLAPGHSPLDWARISGPNADLRGLPSSTPYLRVTPSMLKAQNGRKGKDAWMALNGKVYNVSPYADFHPGGKPELMRGAGKDGTKLFVGLLVEETEATFSAMDQMD